MRITVVGGGIGGLTAAIALRKVGIDVQVYERASALREVGAGIALSANALEALDALGLADDIRSQSFALMQGGLRNPNGDALLSIPADDFTAGFGRIAVMHRAELLTLLAQRIDPERLHFSRACVGFEQNSEGITARFDNGEAVCADGLIGADGLRSIIRTKVLGGLRARYAGYTVWRAVVDFSSHNKPLVEETWGQGRRFGIVPMNRGRVYWFAVNNVAEGERVMEGQTKAMLSRLFRGWHEPIEALIAAAKEGSILQNDIYDTNPLPRFVERRAGLLGDAAHSMTPNLGQGACQAIEDAVVLGICLKKNGHVEPALLEYERRRMPRTKQFVLRSRWLGAVAQIENAALCWIRDAAMRATPKTIAARQIKSMLNFEILAPFERAMFTQGAAAQNARGFDSDRPPGLSERSADGIDPS